jgi:hypothetical protein
MDFDCAVKRIRKIVDQLNQEAGRTVFDEWVLLEIYGDDWGVHGYHSPDPEAFAAHFQENIGCLEEIINPDEMVVGTLGFVDDEDSHKFDAFMCVGPHVFVFFKNTSQTSEQLFQHPCWASVQARFQRAMHVFIDDPLMSPHTLFQLGRLRGDSLGNPAERKISEQRYALYGEAVLCPRKKTNPDLCPLHDLRLLPYEQRFAAIDQMSDEEANRLYEYHKKCLKGVVGLNRSMISQVG